MKVIQFFDEGLANTAHLVVARHGGSAILIDPLRDVDRYVAAARAEGAVISHVFDTHLHNDFLSGGRELASLGAQHCAGAAAELAWDHLALGDGTAVTVGELDIVAMATPGHTPEHVVFLVTDRATPGPAALFSGGALLAGGIARTDLLGPEHTNELTDRLFRSLRVSLAALPDSTELYPTHGGGSFCTAAPGAERRSTLGHERRFNRFLNIADPAQFRAAALEGLGSYPEYFRAMRAINQSGPRVLGGLPVPAALSPRDVGDRLDRGAALLDLRPAARYAAGHVAGAFHSEYRQGFAVWAGWVIPFGTPLVLVPPSNAILPDAVRQLIRIGYDTFEGYLDGGEAEWAAAGLPIARVPLVGVRDLARQLELRGPLQVLDVRQDAEWAAGHIPGARHAEAGSVARGLPGLSAETPLAVHCGHLPRAATALSVLERAGYRDLRLVKGGFTAWVAAGLPVAHPPAGP